MFSFCGNDVFPRNRHSRKSLLFNVQLRVVLMFVLPGILRVIVHCLAIFILKEARNTFRRRMMFRFLTEPRPQQVDLSENIRPVMMIHRKNLVRSRIFYCL